MTETVSDPLYFVFSLFSLHKCKGVEDSTETKTQTYLFLKGKYKALSSENRTRATQTYGLSSLKFCTKRVVERRSVTIRQVNLKLTETTIASRMMEEKYRLPFCS